MRSAFKELIFLEIACYRGGKELSGSNFTTGQAFAYFGQKFACI